MSTRRITTTKREEVEAWWPLIARVLAFFFGVLLIYREQQPPPGVEKWIIMAGIACMGPAVAATFVDIIVAFRGRTTPVEEEGTL